MTADVIDRLLRTLDVRIQAFAFCEIARGWRLVFDPMNAVSIHYVLSGAGVLRVADGLDFSYGPSTIIVVPANVPQSLGEAEASVGEANAAENCGLFADGFVKFVAGEAKGDTLIVCATISASYNGALGLFEQLRAPVSGDVSDSKPLSALFDVMLAEIAKPEVGTRALTEALMKQCLIILLRQHMITLGAKSPFFLALEDQRLARAVLGVVEHPATPHTVESLASLAGMSRTAFAERFVRCYGETPIEFVQRVRLRQGARLLAATDLPIKVIASSIGYKSRSYFTRVFRSIYGIEPRAFRAKAAEADRATKLGGLPFADRVVDTMGSV